MLPKLKSWIPIGTRQRIFSAESYSVAAEDDIVCSGNFCYSRPMARFLFCIQPTWITFRPQDCHTDHKPIVLTTQYGHHWRNASTQSVIRIKLNQYSAKNKAKSGRVSPDNPTDTLYNKDHWWKCSENTIWQFFLMKFMVTWISRKTTARSPNFILDAQNWLQGY